jgi:hypothetical protein
MPAAVSGGNVKRARLMLAVFVCPLLVLSACGPGNQLRIPGDIARPPFSGPPPAGTSRASVADFTYTPGADGPEVIGRDYDRARHIVWKGHPGKAVADLVAGALSERGIPTVRRKADDPASDNVPYLVSGAVRLFEVNVHRHGVLKINAEAVVSLSITVTGTGLPAPWETLVTSTTQLQDIFPIPEELQRALESAANTAADEAVRRLRESGAAGAFPGGGAGGDGTSR